VEFTAEQLYAIERRKGELLLDAGAGSGKTSVLVERFARAIQEDGIAVGQILTITFTEKAAAELRERIRARLRDGGDEAAAQATEGAWISTIHAFCARLLRTHALEAGIDPEFKVLDERDASELRRSAFNAALATCARTPAGAELIAAHGPVRLRSAILEVHAELRAGGMLEPDLAPVSSVTSSADLEAAGNLVLELAQAAQRELGRLPDPGSRISDALSQLERVPGLLDEDLPWPGELRAVRLGTGASALKSQTCSDYNGALDELAEMIAAVIAVDARDALSELLREYDSSYTALKRRQSGLDFGDLELLARELLRRHDLARRYQERFARVMVDEMQDTNSVQLELIDLVAGPDLFMVGDAQQSIYGFRHADVELFQERGVRLARIGARASLQTNFRSRPEILEAINGAFAGALGAGFMPLRPGREEPPAGDLLVEMMIVDRMAFSAVDDPDNEFDATPWRVAEARVLAARVSELIGAGEAGPGEIVLLTRATTDMRVYEQTLEQAGVPTYVIGGRGYWSHPQVVELTSYLRALANPLDTDALYTVLLSPLCGLSLDGLVLRDAAAVEQLSEIDRERLEVFDSWFREERRMAAWSGPEQLIDRALALSGYDAVLAGLPDGRRRLANVRKLMRLAREWQAAHGSDLRGFVDMLQTRALIPDGARESEAPVESESLDAVRLMTIHRSKGLEFPVVCVADLGRQSGASGARAAPMIRVGRDGESLGLRLKRPGYGEQINALSYDRLVQERQEQELSEERRLFYVAMTRAKERLIISGAARFDDWETTNRRTPIGWVGSAFAPDIAARACALAGGASSSATFTTGLGVRVSLIDQFQPATRVGQAFTTTPSPVFASGWTRSPAPAPAPTPTPTMAPAPPAVPHVGTLSYTALATYELCPYRFYAERVLGLPEAPPVVEVPTREAPVPGNPTLLGAARGTLIHELLASMDFKEPALPESMPAAIRELLAGMIGSSTFMRLAALREVRREQRFAFPVANTLITGVFDLIGREGAGHVLVVDYKSDRLMDADPKTVVAQRYMAQRAIYALAALKLGAATVEVCHLFLEDPEDPVSEVFTLADLVTLEADLATRVARVGGSRSGQFPVTDSPGRRVCEGCPAQGGLCSHPLELTNRR
jgi:ATP-dependent exoDNAse (exonuclease V) beta subunit